MVVKWHLKWYFKQYNSPDDAIDVSIEKHEFKDLNSDGINDAVVILAGNYGGSGVVYELIALLSKGKEIVQTNSVVLGDRIKIEKIVANPPTFFSFSLFYKKMLFVRYKQSSKAYGTTDS